MLDDLLLGKQILTACGKCLSEEEQEILSEHRGHLPAFLSTQEGRDAVQILCGEFFKYLEVAVGTE